MRPALLLLLALLALVFPLAGCGAEDEVRERAQELREDVERGIERAKEEFEERRERYGRRFREVMEDLEKVFERPEETSPVVRSRGRNEPQTIDAFLTDVLQDVDRYWSRTLATADLPEPVVRYAWVPPGRSLLTGCGDRAGDDAALYCPADDTIYIGQRFAAAVYRAAGDFAVAYVVAHEYGHNLQQELGIFDNRVSESAKPFELQADCFAGTWAYSVFAAGALKPGDLEEATNAALAVGDFDVGNAQHHGTPTERRNALLAGFESGDPAACSRYVERPV